MASPVDIASIFMRKGQTPTPETQTPSQGRLSSDHSLFVRAGLRLLLRHSDPILC